MKPVSEILAWCLMTNHFHFLIEVTNKGIEPIKSGGIVMPAITNGFRLLQSSYAKGINKQQDRTGNLFQQKTKAKIVSDEENYSRIAFHYIHQNSVVAKLVLASEDWKYSSFTDYAGVRNGTLCNKEKAIRLLNISMLDLKAETAKEIKEDVIKKIFL